MRTSKPQETNTTITVALITVLLMAGVASPKAVGQTADPSPVPSLVEVYWQSSKAVVIQGISNLVVLDPEITRAETGYDTVQFFGLERGETVVLGYINDKPVSIRVRVIARPVNIPSPAMLRRQSEMAHGLVGTEVQLFNNAGVNTVSLLSNFAWSQAAGNQGRLDLITQTEDNNYAGGHAFNVRNASVRFENPGMELQALDYAVSLTNNDPVRRTSPYMPGDTLQLRGAALTLRRGDNRYMLFGGATVPFFYLTLSGTRDIGGFSFMRKQSEKLSLFSTSSYINTPTNFLGLSGARESGFIETGGFSYALNNRWSFQATGGGGSHGGMARGEADYVTRDLSFFLAGSRSSTLFPLNQLLSLFSENASVKSGFTLRNNEHFSESVYYQHAVTSQFNNVIHAGSSDYLTPSLSYQLNRQHDIIFTYTFSRNDGGFASQTSTGNRFDTNWRYQIAPQVANNAQVTIGSVQDPLQLNSEDEFTVRDSFSFPIKTGNMLLAFEHARRNPSLVEKLSSELNLLSPALQALFLQDPIAFVESNSLPPEVRALLNAQVPVDTSFYAAAQLHPWPRLTLVPNFSVARATAANTETWTPFAGYNLLYAVTPTLRLTSGLSSVWTFNSRLTSEQRTTLFSFGLVKTFHAMPASLVPGRGGRIIEGRVFRDNNLNGVFNRGEQGLEGLRVELDSGESAITDEQGRYRFTGVAAGEHLVKLDLTQFPAPVRMTTRNQAAVDLIQRHIAIIDFGVVNFSRLFGNVFNDARSDGTRQADSKSMANIRLVLDPVNGRDLRSRTIVAEDGTYQVDDVPPGDYKLSVDPASLPANYEAPAESFNLHVAPVASVSQDIPLRALRSIAGRVFLKTLVDAGSDPGKLGISHAPANTGNSNHARAGSQSTGQPAAGAQQAPGPAAGGEYKLVPLAGVQLIATSATSRVTATATSDESGNFLLRDLPAGEITVSVLPVKPLPEGMKTPKGVVRLPAEPIQVQGATIVITNPDLVPYLTLSTPLSPETIAAPAGSGGHR